MALTLALNYGKFRRYVTREEVTEWANNFRIEALKEAKANLKGRIAEIGNIKKAWEKPVQVRFLAVVVLCIHSAGGCRWNVQTLIPPCSSRARVCIARSFRTS